MNYLTLLLLSLQLSECAIISRDGADTKISKLNSTATLKWNLNGVVDNSAGTVYSVHYNQDKNAFLQIFERSYTFTKPLTVEDNDPFNGRVSGTITLNNGNGVLSVELQNVEYDDSGNFTFNFVSTIIPQILEENVDISLDVQGGPSKCGDQDLPKNFTCSKGDEINGSVTLCGKLRPILSWTIGDQSINGTIDSTKADQHQYTYSFKHNMTSEMCGESVSYRAKGFQNNEVTGSALIQLDKLGLSTTTQTKPTACPNTKQALESDTMSTISFIRCYFEGIGTVLLIEFIIFMVYRYSKQRNKDANQDLSLTTVNANQNAADITDDEVAAPGNFQSNGMDTRTHALSIVNATYMSLKRTKEKSLYEV